MKLLVNFLVFIGLLKQFDLFTMPGEPKQRIVVWRWKTKKEDELVKLLASEIQRDYEIVPLQ